MHQHREPERTGLVIDIAEQAAEQEGRQGLPGVQVDEGEEQGGDDDGPDGLHAVSEQSAQDHAAAEPFLEKRGENTDGKEVDQYASVLRHPLEQFLQCLRHLGQQREKRLHAEGQGEGGEHHEQGAQGAAQRAEVAAVQFPAAAGEAVVAALDAGVDHRRDEHQRIGDERAVFHAGLLAEDGDEGQDDDVGHQGAQQEDGKEDEQFRHVGDIPGEFFQETVVPGSDAPCHGLIRKGEWGKRLRGRAGRTSRPRRGGLPCRSRRTSGTAWKARRSGRRRRGSGSRWRRGCRIPS